MQYKETQYSHEMRKREKEYSRLKVTLGQVGDSPSPPHLLLSFLCHSRWCRTEVDSGSWVSVYSMPSSEQVGRDGFGTSPGGRPSPIPVSPYLIPDLSSCVEETYRAIITSYEERQKVIVEQPKC